MLVHSPLVGPSTWRWVGEALTSAGHEVAIPDVRSGGVTGHPQAAVEAVLEETASGPATIVGHSGAGFLLPWIVDRFDPPATCVVFVDAAIPPCGGEVTAGADFLDRLRDLAVGGILPKWSTWWGEDGMEQLVPDRGRRKEIEAEVPEVPLTFYEVAMRLPAGWCDVAGAFLLLSEPYRPDADRARLFGWPVSERLGSHLDIVSDPDSVAHDLVEIVG